MIALTPFEIQVAGIVVLVAIGIAALWWVARAAMGWHDGRPFYWLQLPPDDDRDDEDPDDDDGGGAAHGQH